MYIKISASVTLLPLNLGKRYCFPRKSQVLKLGAIRNVKCKLFQNPRNPWIYDCFLVGSLVEDI